MTQESGQLIQTAFADDRPVTYRAHPAYLKRESGGANRTSIVGKEGCWGSRWFHGVLCFERYTTDMEPSVPKDGQGRFITWQPVKRTDRPNGWWRGFPGMSIGLTGYAMVPESGGIDRDWEAHARRHLVRWRKSGWSIREISLDEYREAYSGSKQDVILRTMFGSILNEKLRHHEGLWHMYGASPTPDGKVEAGFVCVDVPETKESLHLMSFIRPAAYESSAGTGLMAHWFETALTRGLKYLDFGIFWKEGDPKSWKGFSRFKSQFGIRFVKFPTPLVRITRGR